VLSDSWWRLGAAGLAAIALALPACGGSDTDESSGDAAAGETTAGDPSKDKLAQVLGRGTLILFTDPEYAPQSFTVKGAKRPVDTKCTPNELTAAEVAGYDADTGKVVAEALGVEPCFVTPSWTEVTAGNWGDRWDLAYGSGAIDLERMEVLYMTQPYYATPNVFFVRKDSPARRPENLSGKTVGACAGCTMEKYLRRTLKVPGPPLKFVVDNPEIVTFDTEPPGLAATAKGKIDAFLCSEPVGAEEIAKGVPLRILQPAAYLTYKTGYVDKSSGLDVGPFVERVNKIVAEAHESGKLRELSMKYFRKDYATEAGTFDLTSIGQTVE
jgi:polar amino acid transport system substrate-binding protein